MTLLTHNFYPEINQKYTYVGVIFVCKDKMCEINIDHVEAAADGDGFFCDIFTMAPQSRRNIGIL